MARKTPYEKLQREFSKLSDTALASTIKYDYSDLNEDGKRALLEEIEKRGQTEQHMDAIKIWNSETLNQEYQTLVEKIHMEACPHCGASGPISASVSTKVFSYVIMTHKNKNVRVGCPSCNMSKLNNDTLATAFLGWWGIPWGPIYTIGALGGYFGKRRKIKRNELNDALYGIVGSNYVDLKTAENDSTRLMAILKKPT